MTDFKLRLEEQPRWTRIKLEGELDLGVARRLDEALQSVEQGDATTILLDLRALRFIDSVGLSTILRAQVRSNANGHVLEVVPGPPAVQRVFRTTGTDDRLTFVQDADIR